MNISNYFKILIFTAAIFVLTSPTTFGQQVQRARFDVSHYNMDVTLSPNDRKLTATVDVTFTTEDDSRTVSFELNGSLKMDSVARIDRTAPVAAATPPVRGAARPTPVPQSNVTFVQDQSNNTILGPHVRVDIGETVAKGTPITLRFKYHGILETPQGGPLLNKRLAYVGDQLGYLMYAARWFPFNDYAADQATSDVTITLPAGYQVAGFSEQPVAVQGNKHRFIQTTPSLPGNFAYGKLTPRTLRIMDQELNFLTRSGNDSQISLYGEALGRALDNYNRRFGNANHGKKLTVVQIDDDSLDYYSARGMIFVGSRIFDEARDATVERLQREAAYQWWGLTVGLESFDDAWLSQGLAEFSAFSLREEGSDAARLESIRRELVEKALTFEQTASILQAPKNLDDQSIAYQYIMYGKGAMAFKLLRDTLGNEKFERLLRTYLNEYRSKAASIDDFERLATRIADTNMRYFFARWVEGTGVPEFLTDYLILRTSGGKFVTRGTVKQNYDNLRLPVDIQLRSEGDQGLKTITLDMEESNADYNIESDGKPIAVIVDPGYKLLRISDDLRVSSIARRGIEQMREGNYADAQVQFTEALKLDRSNSWVYYHLGLLFLEQRNYDMAIDNFKASISGNLNPAWLNVWSYIKMGNAYDGKGDRTRAVAAYKRAEALGDNYDKAQDIVQKFLGNPYDPRETNPR